MSKKPVTLDILVTGYIKLKNTVTLLVEDEDNDDELYDAAAEYAEEAFLHKDPWESMEVEEVSLDEVYYELVG